MVTTTAIFGETMTKVINLVEYQPDEEGRLIVKFFGPDEIQIEGNAGSANMALASVILAKLATESLEPNT